MVVHLDEWARGLALFFDFDVKDVITAHAQYTQEVGIQKILQNDIVVF